MENDTIKIHSGVRPPDPTRQRQYDELGQATTIAAIAQTEIGHEASLSPVWQKYVEKWGSFGEK